MCFLFLSSCANRIRRLAELDGDWHEFESKALRKENERKEKELRRQSREKEIALKAEKDKKRGPEDDEVVPGAKREKLDPAMVTEAVSKEVVMAV